jgi:hypothetical protein
VGQIAGLEAFVALVGYQRLSEQLHYLTILASGSVLSVGLRSDGRTHVEVEQTRLNRG